MTASEQLGDSVNGSNFTGGENYGSRDESFMETFILFYLPTVIFLGLIGNIFSAVVILATSLRKVPPNHYLASLTLADSVFLVALIPIWLKKLGFTNFSETFWCHFCIYLLNCSCWQSSWSITVLAVERYFAILFPVVSQRFRNDVTQARVKVLLILPFALAYNVWVFVIIESNGYSCDIVTSYETTSLILNAVDMLLVFVIPAVLIVLSNISIALTVIRKKKFSAIIVRAPRHQQQSSPVSEQVAGLSSPLRRHQHQKTRNRQQSQLRRVLVVVPCVFLALNFPSYAVRILNFVEVLSHTGGRLSATRILISQISLIIYYANYSLNFVVYCLASPSFRQAVVAIWNQKTTSGPGGRLKERSSSIFAHFRTTASNAKRTPELVDGSVLRGRGSKHSDRRFTHDMVELDNNRTPSRGPGIHSDRYKWRRMTDSKLLQFNRENLDDL